MTRSNESYITVHDVGCHGRTYGPEEPISFDNTPADILARDQLLAAGAIVAVAGQAPTAGGAGADEGGEAKPKPLSKQNHDELLATAAAEGVAVPDTAAANKVIAGLIQAARDAKTKG